MGIVQNTLDRLNRETDKQRNLAAKPDAYVNTQGAPVKYPESTPPRTSGFIDTTAERVEHGATKTHGSGMGGRFEIPLNDGDAQKALEEAQADTLRAYDDARRGLDAPKATQAECSGLGTRGEYYKIYDHDFRSLLGRVLDTLDMAVPNKQQHAAAVRAVRTSFDEAYHEAMALTHPNTAFGQSEPWAVEPIR